MRAPFAPNLIKIGRLVQKYTFGGWTPPLEGGKGDEIHKTESASRSLHMSGPFVPNFSKIRRLVQEYTLGGGRGDSISDEGVIYKHMKDLQNKFHQNRAINEDFRISALSS